MNIIANVHVKADDVVETYLNNTSRGIGGYASITGPSGHPAAAIYGRTPDLRRIGEALLALADQLDEIDR